MPSVAINPTASLTDASGTLNLSLRWELVSAQVGAGIEVATLPLALGWGLSAIHFFYWNQQLSSRVSVMVVYPVSEGSVTW